ncbi:MAG TPA: c-type cytochrome [Thiomicrospira sp.]|nr:c-type cytochrome [Thiomicrospira sp.]
MKMTKLTISLGITLASALTVNTVMASAHASKVVDPWTTSDWLQTKRDMPKGDKIRGEKLVNDGYCYSCHGVNGVNPTKSTPSLAGQNATYTYKMLLDYQSGLYHIDHKSDVMIDLMNVYNKQDMADMAAYYEAQRLPHQHYAPETSTATSETIKMVKKGDVSRLIVPCASCHGAHGEGGMNETPALAGMNPRMFVRQMKAYRSGDRNNDVANSMAQFATELTDVEIKALADYYATLSAK